MDLIILSSDEGGGGHKEFPRSVDLDGGQGQREQGQDNDPSYHFYLDLIKVEYTGKIHEIAHVTREQVEENANQLINLRISILLEKRIQIQIS